MSKIEDQIKALQLKKLKIDFISKISDMLRGLKLPNFTQIQEEVVAKIDPFLIELITSIENDTEISAKPESSQFTAEEVTAIKILLSKIKDRPSQTESPAAPKQNLIQPQSNVPPRDKMEFAMENRSLAGRMVKVLNDQNLNITGKVVGLDSPFVLVQTDQDVGVLKVPLERIQQF